MYIGLYQKTVRFLFVLEVCSSKALPLSYLEACSSKLDPLSGLEACSSKVLPLSYLEACSSKVPPLSMISSIYLFNGWCLWINECQFVDWSFVPLLLPHFPSVCKFFSEL